MYELPDDSVLAHFVGRRLEMISCTSNQVIFLFDRSASLVAECAFALDTGEGVEQIEVPLSSVAVLGLLEHELVAAEATKCRRTLRLRFSAGWQLTFHSDDAYESFHLSIEGKQFHV